LNGLIPLVPERARNDVGDLASLVRPLANNAADSAQPERAPVVVIGAGPAGLTAALHLVDHGRDVLVVESTESVGGISQTVERQGWRFDIGGHRFFTKVAAVEAVWHRLLDDHDFLVRPRLSRIHYNGKFFDYPLNARNALKNLGVVDAALCVGSYVWAHVRPPRDRGNFEGWVQARFGRRLYSKFFKTYTEKVWGLPATSIQADWAAQRIKNLSLGRAVLHAVIPQRRRGNQITSLIEQFHYPRLGPGMMWEACRKAVVERGGRVRLGHEVVALHHRDSHVESVTVSSDRRRETVGCEAVISSMPIGELVERMVPAPPAEVLEAARGLHHRDFLTVALVVPEHAGFPDNWIYIHSPDVRVGRIQNFGRWSPDMVRPGWTCLGLEYFVHEGDETWSMHDADLIELARRELAHLDIVDANLVEQGYVVRIPKAYPVYDESYAERIQVLRRWLEQHAVNVQPVGRNGMHRYNNQDHSMLTAMYAVENLVLGQRHDLWAVNLDDEYHEETSARSSASTGRDAPLPVTPAGSSPGTAAAVGGPASAGPLAVVRRRAARLAARQRGPGEPARPGVTRHTSGSENLDVA
jgi:protoporphyrinogen oxidase